MTTGIYPGSFDPLTFGHLDIIKRASKLVDQLYIAIGTHATKNAFLSAQQRTFLIEAEMKTSQANVASKIEVISFNNLVVDLAKDLKADVIIRGIRNSTDFEYEAHMAAMNKDLYTDCETIFISAQPKYQHISSTLVRQIYNMGGDINKFVPPLALELLNSYKK